MLHESTINHTVTKCLKYTEERKIFITVDSYALNVENTEVIY